MILDALLEQPKVVVEGQELTFYLDLCPLTKEKEGTEFFTNKLTSLVIAYKWGFPFKLLIEYSGRTVVLKTIQ